MFTLLAGFAIGIGVFAIAATVKIHNPALPLLAATVQFYEKTLQFMINDFVLIDLENGVLTQIWRAILIMKPLIMSTASSLAVIFFMLNFLSEVQDLHRDLTPRTLFKLLISIGLVKVLILNSYQIITWISSILIQLAKFIDIGVRRVLSIQQLQAGTLNQQTFDFLNKEGSALEMGFLAVLTLIISAVIIFSSISVIRYFIERAVHVLILILFAPIFLAFFINKHTFSMFISYLKEVAFKYSEGVATVLAVILVGLIIRIVGVNIFDFTQQYQVLFSVMFTVTVTSMVVQNIHRVFDRIR